MTFLPQLEISMVAVKRILEHNEKWLVSIFHSGNDFQAVLALFCCYDYGVNASEAVEKIAADQK